jgi:hypothetical protein
MDIPVVLSTLSEIRQFRQRDHWTRKLLEAHQAEALRSLRDYAYAYSPFYRGFHLGLVDAPLHDPDFDTWYPLSAIISLLLTPPPQPLMALQIPTMFMVALRGVGGRAYVDYLKDLYNRLPNVKKRLVEVDGSVYWMLSHPKEAAQVIGEWFDETLSLVCSCKHAENGKTALTT